MLQYIIPNFLICRLTLRHSQIHLIHIQLHLNMMLDIKLGQQTHRLNGITSFPQELFD